MIGYEAWKVFHIAGALVLFAALGALAAGRAGGGDGRTGKALHGAGLALLLLTGFALLAKLGLGGPGSWGTWVWIKLGVFVLLGASLTALRRLERAAGWLLAGALLLGALAAWAAVVKPGN